MTEYLHKSTQELITKIEKKDRRFRMAQTIFMIMLIIGIAVGSWFVIQAFEKEAQRRADQTEAIVNAQSAKIDELSNKLQCITNFFTQIDRENLVITDPNQCFTQRINNGDTRQLNQNPGPSQSPENNNTNGEASRGNTQTPAPDQTGNQPPDAGSGNGGNPPDEHPPVEIIGIPVCVPFTNVCVRE